MNINSKILLGLALVLVGAWFGCSTTKPALTAGAADAGQIKLPIKFADYREFFIFAARNTYGGMPTDRNTLFKLAADSTIKIVALDFKQMPYVYVVEDHFFKGEFDEIRGAQGNGEYYILRPLADNAALGGFELVGILEGNAYTVQYINGTPRFVSYCHLSADDHSETVYEWNGKSFELKK